VAKKILAVDDSATMRHLFKMTLTRAGFEAGTTGWMVKPFEPEQLLSW